MWRKCVARAVEPNVGLEEWGGRPYIRMAAFPRRLGQSHGLSIGVCCDSWQKAGIAGQRWVRSEAEQQQPAPCERGPRRE